MTGEHRSSTSLLAKLNKLLSAFLKFSGLMHHPRVPSYRHLRVLVSLVHWMAHLNLLSGGLAL
jgi:hypothetical protein